MFRAIAIALSACATIAGAQAGPLEYIGQQIVPSDTRALGTTVGGLSGIDFDPRTGTFWAISDDRSSLQPARFYNLSLDLSRFNRAIAPGNRGVQFNSVTTLLRPDGTAFPSNQVDPEAIRLGNGALFWTSEGAHSGRFMQDPFVREMHLDGTHVRELALPARYRPVAGPPASGVRDNLAFESLAFDASSNRLYAATENALIQDGPAATLADGSPCRVLALDAASGKALAEYVYVTEPIVHPPLLPGSLATNGLAELLALGDGRFLAVERSFSAGMGTSIRIYLADLAGASDVSALDSLAGAPYLPMRKTLLLDLTKLTNSDGTRLWLDNIEAIGFGPSLGGNATLLLVSDNNFSARQFTQILAFRVTGPWPVAPASR
jgi:hypothetical protein